MNCPVKTIILRSITNRRKQRIRQRNTECKRKYQDIPFIARINDSLDNLLLIRRFSYKASKTKPKPKALRLYV